MDEESRQQMKNGKAVNCMGIVAEMLKATGDRLVTELTSSVMREGMVQCVIINCSKDRRCTQTRKLLWPEGVTPCDASCRGNLKSIIDSGPK